MAHHMIYLRAEVIRSTRRDGGRSTSRPRDATPPSSCDNKENLACCSSLQSSPCFGKLKVAKPFRGWRQSGPLPLLYVLRRSLSILTALYFPPSRKCVHTIRSKAMYSLSGLTEPVSHEFGECSCIISAARKP